MNCPYCYSEETRVLRTKQLDGGDRIERTRVCEKCDQKLTTVENIVKIYLITKGRKYEVDYQKN